MKQFRYVSNRVLKLNVGFLIGDGPGHSHDFEFDVPSMVQVTDDLTLNYVCGPVRLSCTKEGILVQAQLKVGIGDECYRCLNAVDRDIAIKLEELYVHANSPGAEFGVNADGILDLAPLLRAEVLLATTERVLCQSDCRGLCPQCGTNYNHTTCDCEQDDIDPRFVKLKELLDQS